MKYELYKKVYIKSEADLPKEDGVYIAHSKIFDKVGNWKFKNYENDNFPEYCKKQWLDNIDWYLLPVSTTLSRDIVKKIILWTQDALHYGKITGSDNEIADRCMSELCASDHFVDVNNMVAGENDPESDIPKHPTSWRDGEMTDAGQREEKSESDQSKLISKYEELVDKSAELNLFYAEYINSIASFLSVHRMTPNGMIVLKGQKLREELAKLESDIAALKNKTE